MQTSAHLCHCPHNQAGSSARHHSTGKWRLVTAETFGPAQQPDGLNPHVNLAQGHWPVLQSLKLVKCYLSCESVRLLVGGKWSNLESLDLSKDDLRLEAYVWLGKSKWPTLRKLVLKDPQQRLDNEMCRELTKAEWPLLQELCLDFIEINSECIDELNVAK